MGSQSNMSLKFVHTADWQLGKPFAGIQEEEKRILVQQERLNVLHRIGQIVRERQAEFVLVAGDIFDSPTPTRSLVAAACGAIGSMKVPVYAIPGNHDHAGPGGVWGQKFFLSEQQQLAPNLHLLLASEAVVLPQMVLFPCPLLRRHEAADPTSWLRSPALDIARFGDQPRILLAHGSVQGFAAPDADEESDEGVLPNQIDLGRLPADSFDYIALGDWHGTKRVSSKAWYAGTPELDRFPKGEGHDPGNILLVTAGRGVEPEVEPVRTARFGWHELSFHCAEDQALARLETAILDILGGRAGQDLLRLQLSGSLSLEAAGALERKLEAWNARLLRMKLLNQTTVAPSHTEIEALRSRPADPLISRVSAKLLAAAESLGEEGAIARVALRELYSVCQSGPGA
jgi:DNA repair exonuclease SbcCD nuclease subunit